MTPARKAVLIAAVLAASASSSATAAQQKTPPTPPKWGYELRDGRRVARETNRVVNPDGSWREVIRQGKCVTIKERSAAGEYKETRTCNGK